MSILISTAYAATENSSASEVQNLYVHTDYGNGDVVFTVINKATICHGYWLNANQVGFEQAFSTVLSAYHSNVKVEIIATTDENQKWSGSSDHYCKLNRITLKK